MGVHSYPRMARSVRLGGILLIVGPLLFALGTIVAASDFPSGFSALTTHVTALGDSAESPHYLAFDFALAGFGLLSIAGFLLAWGAFPAGTGRVVGLGLLLLSSIADIGVAAIPGVSNAVHADIAQVIFLAGGLAFLVLGVAMSADARWRPFRWPTVVLGVVVLVSYAILFYTSFGWNQYPGLFGFLAIGPILAWEILIGAHIARIPVRARGHLVPGA